MYTDYHSQYWAHALTLKSASNSIENLSRSISNAKVDLNPHQVDAALFAFRSPLSKGSILVDEVGLGKTIEAGIVLAQRWAERKRRILLILPAKIERWSDDLINSTEGVLSKTKSQIKELRRQSRDAASVKEQAELQERLRDLERKQRKQRQQIFDMEDEIADKRDALIDGLRRRLKQQTSSNTLFTIRWSVV